MKFNLKSFLKDKNVLRLIAVISLINLSGYIMVKNMAAVILFILVGFLTTYFSKNMIIVLFTAMITTNLFAISNNNSPIYQSRESFKGSGRNRTTDIVGNYKPAPDVIDQSLASNNSGLNIDAAGTFKSMIESLDNQLEPSAINSMTDSTDKLIKKQQNLQKQVKDLTPALNQSIDMINKVGGTKGIESMIDKVEGMLSRVGGLSKVKK